MKFALATPEHNPAQRRLARDEGMPGPVRLAYTREPDWFAGQAALGHLQQTVVALDARGEVIHQGYFFGRPIDIDVFLARTRVF